MTQPPQPPYARGEMVRDVLDALSATGAALGAVECIRREALPEARQVAALAVVERNLCAAVVALEGLASGLGIRLKTVPTESETRGHAQ